MDEVVASYFMLQIILPEMEVLVEDNDGWRYLFGTAAEIFSQSNSGYSLLYHEFDGEDIPYIAFLRSDSLPLPFSNYAIYFEVG